MAGGKGRKVLVGRVGVVRGKDEGNSVRGVGKGAAETGVGGRG